MKIDFKWDEREKDTWDEMLADCTSDEHQSRCVQAAGHLRCQRTLDVSRDVVRHVCRCGGPIDRLLEREEPVESLYTIDEVLSHLVEVDRNAVADLLERAFTEGKSLSPLAIWNRYLAQTLAKIAFKADTFETGARLLFRLATAVNRANVTRLFADLFSPIGGSTEADGNRRIELLNSVSASGNTNELEIVAEALAVGLQIAGYTRSDLKMHGTYPDRTWYPETAAEASDYVNGCAQRLINLAVRSDPVGIRARKVLARCLEPLIIGELNGVSFVEVVEQAVGQVGQAVDNWPEARDALDRYLSDLSNATPEELMEQAQALRKKRVTWAKAQLKRLEPK